MAFQNRDQVALLRYEANRRPEVASLLARAEAGDLSDEEIAQANVPLPWFRLALTRVRDNVVASRTRAELVVAIEDHIVTGTVPDDTGMIAEYVGQPYFTSDHRGVLVETGALLFFPAGTDTYWFDTVFVEKGAYMVEPLTQFVANGTRTTYQDLRQERLTRQNPFAPVIDLGADPSAAPQSEAQTRLAGLGVRIGR